MKSALSGPSHSAGCLSGEMVQHTMLERGWALFRPPALLLASLSLDSSFPSVIGGQYCLLQGQDQLHNFQPHGKMEYGVLAGVGMSISPTCGQMGNIQGIVSSVLEHTYAVPGSVWGKDPSQSS